MKRRHRVQRLRAPHVYSPAMNLPYDSCALWLIFGEFCEETRVEKITTRRGDGGRQCDYHCAGRERWPGGASLACRYSAILSVPIWPSLGSGPYNPCKVHESPSLMPGEISEERFPPSTFCLLLTFWLNWIWS